ncbi:hypothetical protein Tco_0415806 [Tanacetum coccineum]
MPYPRFTKVIIDHFISEDNTISMRNKIILHTARDDSLLAISSIQDISRLFYKVNSVLRRQEKFKKPTSPNSKTAVQQHPPKVRTQKGKRVKRPAKKATTALTTGVVIRDTPGKSVLKKKAPSKTNRCKGIELLSDVALIEEAQLKKTLRKSKRETHKLQASGSRFVKEEDDGHVTLTTVHDKTEGTMKSSSVSSDFTSKLLNLDNIGPDVNEIASLMNILTVPPPPPPVNPSSQQFLNNKQA